MDLTTEQLEAASDYVYAVRESVVEAVSNVPSPKGLDYSMIAMASLDGIIAAAAASAAAFGIAPSNKLKRRLADEVRTGFLKSMTAAEEELGGTGQAH